jgi:hypothetical protein
MVYLPNIPQPTDDPATQSQAQFLENFQQLDTQFGFDHIAFSAGADNGEHVKVTFNDVSADPGLASPKASCYTKADAGGSTQLFYENFDVVAGANVRRQLTNLTVTQAGTNYGITTPWGLIQNWGSITSNANTPVAATFAVPFTSSVHSITVSAVSDNGTGRSAVVSSGSVGLNTFSVRSTNGGMLVYYYAIGV